MIRAVWPRVARPTATQPLERRNHTDSVQLGEAQLGRERITLRQRMAEIECVGPALFETHYTTRIQV